MGKKRDALKTERQASLPAQVIGANVVERSRVWVTGHIPGIGEVRMQLQLCPAFKMPSAGRIVRWVQGSRGKRG